MESIIFGELKKAMHFTKQNWLIITCEFLAEIRPNNILDLYKALGSICYLEDAPDENIRNFNKVDRIIRERLADLGYENINVVALFSDVYTNLSIAQLKFKNAVLGSSPNILEKWIIRLEEVWGILQNNNWIFNWDTRVKCLDCSVLGKCICSGIRRGCSDNYWPPKKVSFASKEEQVINIMLKNGDID